MPLKWVLLKREFIASINYSHKISSWFHLIVAIKYLEIMILIFVSSFIFTRKNLFWCQNLNRTGILITFNSKWLNVWFYFFFYSFFFCLFVIVLFFSTLFFGFGFCCLAIKLVFRFDFRSISHLFKLLAQKAWSYSIVMIYVYQIYRVFMAIMIKFLFRDGLFGKHKSLHI